MDKNTLTVKLSSNTNDSNNSQTVHFINLINKMHGYKTDNPPKKLLYVTYQGWKDTDKTNKYMLLFNYVGYKNNYDNVSKGVAVLQSGFGNSSIYKQEISETDYNTYIADSTQEPTNPLTPLELVGSQVEQFSLSDVNISNNRYYKYILYPNESNTSVINKQFVCVATHWSGWSITELHPTDSTNKNFTAENKDIWLFNLNVETGAQSQTIARAEQQTLGSFNRYSSGKMNYVTGNVTCLLGQDVVNAEYNETRDDLATTTSNKRVDMLKAWRDLVFSKNPKLLKDREGQSFLVTLTQSSNQPMDKVKSQPNTISFTWTQIGTLDGVTILNTDPKV